MPVMDGFAATREIRQTDNPNATTPIIALTANVVEADRANAMAAGMDGLLNKPVTRVQLAEALEKWARPQPRSAPAAG